MARRSDARLAPEARQRVAGGKRSAATGIGPRKRSAPAGRQNENESGTPAGVRAQGERSFRWLRFACHRLPSQRTSGARFIALLLITLLATGCNGDEAVEVEGVAVPSIDARVLTIRTIVPDSPVLLTTVVIADGKVRLGTETDRWRLFDVENSTVTFVDDIERTYRTETHADLMRERIALLRGPLPEGLAPATIEKTGKSREVEGIAGDQYMIRMGGYQRELWLSTKPAIVPEQLLSMMIASDPVTDETAPAMRQVDSQLSKLRGFPIFERSELKYGDDSLVMEKTLVKIEERPVARSLITIPNDYRDASLKESPDGQQPASLDRAGRSARGAG